MNTIKVIDLIKDFYKPLYVIPSGEEKGKLLLARWKNCAQIVLDLNSVLYYQY